VSSGGMADRLEQKINVAVVNAGDGLAQADGRLVGEAGGEVEHPAFSGRARKPAGLQGVDGCSQFSLDLSDGHVTVLRTDRYLRRGHWQLLLT
jgi:hypothetical protein